MQSAPQRLALSPAGADGTAEPHAALDVFRELAELSTDVIVKFDRSGIRFISPSIQRYGYQPEQLVGRAHTALVHPDDVEQVAALVQDLFETGVVDPRRDRTHRLLTATGEVVWMEGRPALIYDGDGAPVGAVTHLRDVTERRLAEAALAEREAMYDQLTRSVTDVLVHYDASGIRYISDAVRRYGYAPQELIGKPPASLVHPDDIAKVQALNEELLVAGRLDPGRDRTSRCLTAWGDIVWMEGSPSIVRDAEGNPAGVINLFRDISDRVAAAKALAESEARFRLLADNAGDIIARFDGEGRFTYLSPSVEKVLGYRPEELIGQTVRAIMHPEDYEESFRIFREHLAGPNAREAFEYEYRAIHRDGRTIWLAAHPRATFDERGRLVEFQDSVRDVTDRREAAAALAASEARFRLLAENAKDIIMDVRPDGRLLYISPACLTLTGYSPDEVVGRSGEAWVHPDDWPAVVAAFADQVRSRGKAEPRRLEYRVLTSGGEAIWVESEPRANRHPTTGRVVSVTDVVRDITARKAMERHLAEARDAAERAASVKAEFMANMSHEIRTPLTAILGYTNLLTGGGGLDERTAKFVGRIDRAGEALLAIVNDILDFSKLEAGQMTLKPRSVKLEETFRDCLSIFEPQAATKAVDLRLEGAEALPVASIDPDRLRQVLINLIGNAIKFTDAGAVTVRCRHADQTLSVSVQDSGPGLDDEEQAKLFRRFSQVDGSSTRRHGGTGLGLAICSALVEAMGGRIGVRSEPGRGSTFWFEAPAPEAEAEDAALDTTALNLPEDLRVLVVDDNQVNRELTRALLETFGIEVDEAADGDEAIETARRQMFDLILMDLRMPRMSGPAATIAIRTTVGPNQTVPILAFTADYDIQRLGPEVTQCFDDVVGKPIIAVDMLQKIAAHTDPVKRLAALGAA